MMGPMMNRTIKKGTVPPVNPAEMTRMEGHAWRKSLCEGKEIKGFEWLGPNKLYNNGTCEVPVEHWQQCNGHDCSFFEAMFNPIIEEVEELPKKIWHVLEAGAESVWDGVVWMLRKIVPYLLLGLGLIILIPVLARTAVSLLKNRRKAEREPRRGSVELLPLSNGTRPPGAGPSPRDGPMWY